MRQLSRSNSNSRLGFMEASPIETEAGTADSSPTSPSRICHMGSNLQPSRTQILAILAIRYDFYSTLSIFGTATAILVLVPRFVKFVQDVGHIANTCHRNSRNSMSTIATPEGLPSRPETEVTPHTTTLIMTWIRQLTSYPA